MVENGPVGGRVSAPGIVHGGVVGRRQEQPRPAVWKLQGSPRVCRVLGPRSIGHYLQSTMGIPALYHERNGPFARGQLGPFSLPPRLPPPIGPAPYRYYPAKPQAACTNPLTKKKRRRPVGRRRTVEDLKHPTYLSTRQAFRETPLGSACSAIGVSSQRGRIHITPSPPHKTFPRG